MLGTSCTMRRCRRFVPSGVDLGPKRRRVAGIFLEQAGATGAFSHCRVAAPGKRVPITLVASKLRYRSPTATLAMPPYGIITALQTVCVLVMGHKLPVNDQRQWYDTSIACVWNRLLILWNKGSGNWPFLVFPSPMPSLISKLDFSRRGSPVKEQCRGNDDLSCGQARFVIAPVFRTSRSQPTDSDIQG
ncbi:hypothetical protein BDV10DRAFT_52126 [Aspergillus recurvatus]